MFISGFSAKLLVLTLMLFFRSFFFFFFFFFFLRLFTSFFKFNTSCRLALTGALGGLCMYFGISWDGVLVLEDKKRRKKKKNTTQTQHNTTQHNIAEFQA